MCYMRHIVFNIVICVKIESVLYACVCVCMCMYCTFTCSSGGYVKKFFFKKKKKSSWLSQALVVDAGVTEKFIISRYVLSCGMEPLQQK